MFITEVVKFVFILYYCIYKCLDNKKKVFPTFISFALFPQLRFEISNAIYQLTRSLVFNAFPYAIYSLSDYLIIRNVIYVKTLTRLLPTNRSKQYPKIKYFNELLPPAGPDHHQARFHRHNTRK